MAKHKKNTPDEIQKAKAYARAIESGQIIDLGNIPSRDLGLITQGLVQQAAESYLKENLMHYAADGANSLTSGMK